MTEFTHISQQGHTEMVNISDKQIIRRTVVVHSSITVNETIFKQISNNTNTKDNVSNTAQVAGIMAVRSASTLILMCHPLPLTDVDVHSGWDETNAPLYTLDIQTTVSTAGRTGVEMEVLTTASATVLTIHNMTKAVDKGMIIGETYFENKSGGRSGDFQRQSNQ